MNWQNYIALGALAVAIIGIWLQRRDRQDDKVKLQAIFEERDKQHARRIELLEKSFADSASAVLTHRVYQIEQEIGTRNTGLRGASHDHSTKLTDLQAVLRVICKKLDINGTVTERLFR